MSSAPRRGRLDAFAGRDVVYCHGCSNEWYNDEDGLVCPSCGGEATEIVDADNDPREVYSAPNNDSHNREAAHGGDYDSDPEEGDIEEHVHHGPAGFFVHRTIYRTPSQQPEGQNAGPDGRRPADPTNGQDILHRFTEMLMNDFRAGPPGRSGPDALFPPNAPGSAFGFAGPPQIRRTTFATPGVAGGRTSFTIATAPLRRGGPVGPDNFDAVFGNIMGNMSPPHNHNEAEGEGVPLAGLPPGFPTSLHQILSAILNPAGAVHGDAVYSQEALDRIITSLMEANPQSNAAPPASQVAIDKLRRRKLDDDLLSSDGNNTCSICIDDMHKGDEAVVLPCKHWFHEECVTLWLKQHNTCPVCRRPVEGEAPSAQGTPSQQASAPQSQPQSQSQTQPQPQSQSQSPQSQTQSRSNLDAAAATSTSAATGLGSNNPYRRQPRGWRSPTENAERLDAIRNLGGSAYSSSSSSTNRRSSHSPPSTRQQSTAEQASRARQRSPSSGRRAELREPQPGYETREQQGNGDNSSRSSTSGGHGPFSWIRDHLRGSNNSNNSNGSRRS